MDEHNFCYFSVERSGISSKESGDPGVSWWNGVPIIKELHNISIVRDKHFALSHIRDSYLLVLQLSTLLATKN